MRALLTLAGTLGFLGVIAGTFGAHGLKNHLSADLLITYETGVRYHLFHACALLGVAILHGQRRHRLLMSAGVLLAIGIVIFSGSLYLLAVTGVKTWGMVAPLGGVSLMAGWLLIAIMGWRWTDDV